MFFCIARWLRGVLSTLYLSHPVYQFEEAGISHGSGLVTLIEALHVALSASVCLPFSVCISSSHGAGLPAGTTTTSRVILLWCLSEEPGCL